jgi:putative transposase
MYAFVVMPDHVHLLFSPLLDPDGYPYALAKIMHGIKGASAHAINRALGRRGAVWEEEFFDHVIRNDQSFEAKWQYIEFNPVEAGLVENPRDYPWLWTISTYVARGAGRPGAAGLQEMHLAGGYNHQLHP